MPMYRKKPVVIEARQYDGSNADALVRWIGGRSYEERGKIIVPTLEGDHAAARGDWIIRGVKGEFYPCKPDIFDATYEPAR
jgi:hypothetical protein